jgi:dipeptidyl aminopeptidase/acylaminoacyl peptidase
LPSRLTRGPYTPTAGDNGRLDPIRNGGVMRSRLEFQITRAACAAALGLAILAAAAAAQTAPATVAGKAPTVADFVRKSRFESAKISPDGTHIAVTFWRDDVIGLGIVDTRKLKLAGTVWFSHGTHVVDYEWVSDQRVVMALGKSEGMLDQPRLTGELYGMNADGSQQTYLYGYQGDTAMGTHTGVATRERGFAEIVAPLTDEPDVALISTRPWGNSTQLESGLTLWKLDTRSGRKRRAGYVATSRNAGNSKPAAVAANARGEARYALVYGDNGGVIEKRRASSGGDWETVETHRPDVAVHLLGLSDDGGKAYLRIEEDGRRLCTHERDIASGVRNTLSCAPTQDAGDAEKDVDGRPLIKHQWEAGRRAPEVVGDGPKAQAYRMLFNAFPGQWVTITSHAKDGRRFIAQVRSDRNPGDYYLFDLDRKNADYLFSAMDWIELEQMVSVTPVDIKARDGLALHGYVTSRNGLKPEKRPMVVVVHGGPHGVHDTWKWDAWPQYLASLGYAVLQVNYRGSAGYGQAFQSAGYRNWGTAMQDDLTDAVRWAIAAGVADPARVCIMGASYGGYAAVMSPLREPALYRCAIEFAGVVDLVTQASDSDMGDTGFGRQYLSRVLGTSDADLQAHSPVRYLDKLQVPILIAHGTEDERVPFSQAKQLRAELDRLHKPYEWMPFDGEEHGFYVDANHEKFLLAVKAFLEKHVGPGMAGAPATADSTRQ